MTQAQDYDRRPHAKQLPSVSTQLTPVHEHTAVSAAVPGLVEQPSDEGSLLDFLQDEGAASQGASSSATTEAGDSKAYPDQQRHQITSLSALDVNNSLEPVVSPQASNGNNQGAAVARRSSNDSHEYSPHLASSLYSDSIPDMAPKVRFALASSLGSGSFRDLKPARSPRPQPRDEPAKASSVSSSVNSTSAKLRMGLSGITSRSAHPAARRLSMVILLLAVAALGVATWHLVRISSGQLRQQRQIGTVLTNERRGGLVVKSALLIQTAILAADRQVAVFDPQQLAQAVLDVADETEETTAQLNRDLEIFFGQETERLEAEYITVNEVTVTGARVPMNFTLTDACSWYVSHLRRVAPSIAVQNLQNPSILTVLQSGQLVIRQALAASGAERIALYGQVVKNDRDARQLEFFTIFTALVFLTSLFIWVQMGALDAHRRKVLKLLAFVPRSTAQAMKRAMQTQLQADENDEDPFSTAYPVADVDQQDTVQHAQLKAARLFKRSSIYQLRPGCFLTIPVLLVGFLLLLVFSVQESYRARMERAAQQAYLSHRSEERLYLSTSYIAGIGSPTIVRSLVAGLTPAELLQQFDDLRTAQLQILHDLIQGTSNGPMDGIRTLPIKRNSLVGQVLLTEACQLFSPSTEGFGDRAACRQLHSSVLSEAGLQGGVMEFLATGTRSYGTLLADLTQPLPAQVLALAVADSVQATQFAIPYLADTLTACTQQLEDDLYDLFQQELSTMVAIYVLFLLGLWSVVFAVFIPFATKIGQQVTAVQVVLPLIPRDLVQSSKALKVHMEQASRNIILAKSNRDSARQMSIAAMMD